MPELPEVQTVVTTLAPRVVGRRIRAVELHRTDIVHPQGTDLSAHILGRRIRSLSRRAKRIVFTLDDGGAFYIHLGMTGQLTAEPAAADLKKHTHLMLTLEDKDEGGRMKDEKGSADAPPPSSSSFILHPSSFPPTSLRFRDPRRFGGVFWLGHGSLAGDDPRLGPEPLDLRPCDLAPRLRRTTRAIKAALLDQAVIAGLGNIYVDESLFAAGIHPLTPADRLTDDQADRLCRQIKKILRRAIAARGSTLRDYVDGNGRLGTAQTLHRVYDRAGSPCPTCARPIERITCAGRSTHFCPACQPPHPPLRRRPAERPGRRRAGRRKPE